MKTTSIRDTAAAWAAQQPGSPALKGLDAQQQNAVIGHVAQKLGVPASKVADQLMSQWNLTNEQRGTMLSSFGGAGAYQGAKESRPLQKGAGTFGAMGALLANRTGQIKLQSFDFRAVDFSKSMNVISSAQKFIIPVPSFAGGGEPLVYPKGHEKAGQPIADWQGKPIGDKGLVFFNEKDQAVQAVKADGQGVVILNQVSEDQAKQLSAKIGDPSKLTLAKFKEVLEFAKKELGLGDMYNSDKGFIKSKMNPLAKESTGVEAFGLHRRDDRDLCQAVFVPGRGELKGTATTHKFENGAVILKQGKDVRLVQPEIFAQTYKTPDGEAIALTSIPRQDPSKPKKIDFKNVDFSQGVDTVSSAQKFVIPVPSFGGGGEPLVYPKGHEKAGQQIADWQGNPIGDQGLVFFNEKDKAVQAVKSDGNGVVIINQVSEEQADKLRAKFGDDPSKLSLQQFKDALQFAREELSLGDMYNSDKEFIGKKMNALESKATGVQGYGLHRRDDRDLVKAVFVEGQGQFTGTATTHKFDNGAVLVQQGTDARLVQPDIFAQTYRNKDGTALDLQALPRVFPE
ncbi:MAG: hypothetical protein HY791_05880 [Deltaproteobacteria bacterium]|nr:hypothetical protein [Deltaproteobacteria bacterium]